MSKRFWPNSWDWGDVIAHLAIAVAFVALFGFFVWPLFVSVVNAVFWLLRELWQHKWKFSEMGGQSWLEFIAPAIGGFLTAFFHGWFHALAWAIL